MKKTQIWEMILEKKNGYFGILFPDYMIESRADDTKGFFKIIRVRW